jgi:UDP-glucose 4-epimerase
VAIFMSKLLAGETPTLNAYPEEPEGMSRDYVYVEDVARANLLALEKAPREAVNIGCAEPIKTKRILSDLCSIMGRKVSFTPAGPRPGDLRYICLDNGKARAVLGWQPSIGLEEGLRKTAAFFKERAV